MRLRVAHLPRVHRMDYLTLHDHAGEMQTQLLDLQANFADPSTQGVIAYMRQFAENHPDEDPATVAADGHLAVTAFTTRLLR